jgi:hypothetical protein
MGPFTLRVNGTPLSLTGLTVEIVLRASGDFTPIVAGGTVVPDPDQVTNPGKVYYDPAEEDFEWSTSIKVTSRIYYVHWKVTDFAGKVVFFPNGEADQIVVYQQ